MFDAGSAVFTLTGRVIREPFASYGKLVETARAEKEHYINLGAITESAGFEKMLGWLDRTKQGIRTFSAEAKASFDSVTASTTKMAVGSNRDLKIVQDSLGKTSESFVVLDDTSKASADSVSASQTKMVESAGRTADAYKVAKDEIVRSNEQIVESNRVAAGSAGGGRGGGGPGGAGGPFGSGAENQAKKTTAAWKEGANTLANLGKWTTIAGAGVGFLTIKWAADFNRQMELVHTQAGYAQSDVTHLSKAVLDLAPTVGFGPTKLAEALFHIASSGIPANKAMETLKIAAEGAQVGQADLEHTTNALVAVLNTAPKDIHSTSEAMAVMTDIVGHGNLRMEDLTGALTTGVLPAAKGVGLGLRDVGAALDVLTSRGVPAEQAATRLRTTLTLIADPTGKAQKALAELGFSQNRLADDIRAHGLVFALSDLQTALNKTFPPGGHITVEQEREALMKYGQQLEKNGVTGKTLQKDLLTYKNTLQETGPAAVQQSQLITSAFGGARMGTTMMTLMQNIGDLRTHFNQLNKDKSAQQFNKDWQDTQKQFSVQVAQMWAAIQKWGIQLGDFLIPKLKDVVKWLIEAGKWLGHHKVLADALAVVFGTILTAAVVAFFGRFLLHTAEGLKAMGQLGKAIGVELPKAAAGGFKWVLQQLGLMKTAAEETNAEIDATGKGLGQGGAAAGGGGGLLGDVTGGGGPLLGMITGIRGTAEPGSEANPLAVVVMASEAFGLGARGAASAEKTASMAESEAAQVGGVSKGGVFLPPGVEVPPVAGEVAPVAGETAAVAGEGGAGLLAGAGALVMPALLGLGAGAIGQSALGLRGGAVGTLGGGAAGAAIGTLIAPGIGTAIGAGLGAALGPTLIHAIGGIFGSPSVGQAAVSGLTRGFGGANAKQLDNAIQKLLDEGAGAASGEAKAGKYRMAGLLVAQQLEAGWNQYKFQDEPTMFKQLRAEVSKMPPFARDAAAQSAIQFAQELEKQGRLPKGSAQKMLRQVEAEFPSFVTYLRLTGQSSIQAFNDALNFQKTERNVKGSLDSIAHDFPTVSAAMKKAGDTVWQQSGAVIKALQDIVKTGTGPMKKQAEADITALKSSYNTNLAAMLQLTKQNMADISGQVQKGSLKAEQTATANFNNFAANVGGAVAAGVISTQTGTKLINQALDAQLKAYGQKPIDMKVQVSKLSDIAAHASNYQTAARAAQGIRGANYITGAATGGMLPGAEYGLADVMTLVDPQGKPRAKMAGDEAIFNRHQMPYVEAGLQMLGFSGAQDLWSSVNTQHSAGYGKGGWLGRFASGGSMYRGYALPLPPQYMNLPWSPDQGIDIPAPAHTPEYAVGPGVIVQEGISGFGPWAPILKVLAGPLAGDEFYYGHAGPNYAHKGQHVQAGQAISQVGAGIVGISTGPHIEFGFWPPRGGAAVARLLRALQSGAGVAGFGGGAGYAGTPWTPIKPPHVTGHGTIPRIVRAALAKDAAAANTYGQMQLGFGAGSGYAGSLSGPVERQVFQYFSSKGFNRIAIAGMLGNAAQESSMNPNARGGGLFQQISNFGAGTGGPLLHQMEVMYPQIVGLRGEMNAAGSPAAAAAIFMSAFERPAAYAANLHNRQAAAQAAFAAGYGGGGWMGHFAGGGNPWPSLPSGTRFYPGHRPVRVRRGAPGLHTIGSGRTQGQAKGLGKSGTSRHTTTKVGSGKTKRIGITQATANTLKGLGFGNVANIDNLLGQLDSLYSVQEGVYNTFAGPAGLTPDQLDDLMGIREQEWDLAYPLYTTLPGIIGSVQNDVNALAGHQRAGHWKKTKAKGKKPHKSWIPATFVDGVVPDLSAEVTDIENEITSLEHDLQLDARQIATIHHNVTGAAMTLADGYAQEAAGVLTAIDAMNTQKFTNSQKRVSLQNQIRNLPSAGGSGLSLSATVSGVLAGTLPTTGSSTANPTKLRLRNQVGALHAADGVINRAEQLAREHLRQLKEKVAKATRSLRQQGFSEAWQVTAKRWALQDKIYQLKRTLKKLKASLKAETTASKADASALQVLQNAQSGGLQGGSSIGDSLESIAQNILSLYQQGAQLPTPYPKRFGIPAGSGPSMDTIGNFLKKMGISLPPGLVSGQLQASTEAAAAFADFQSFQADRASLFQQFGSNFVGAGVNPQGSTAAVGAGAQFFGAAAGPSAGAGAPAGGFTRGGRMSMAGGPGSTTNTWHFENHFSGGPPDPHTWSSGVAHEVQAMV